ncbi:uncharacterized protein LOC114575184 [Exaiptasia diaphana]|uniref:Uncharacterized protein n=1 Tax=Exaiptasia diaphana TaxID=2652724 RepID=A0A913YJX8_EXADI|nr:uncharacterized protein LOC114575184 [Exaiptasia diaphana]
MEGDRFLPLLVVSALACLVMANNETPPELEKSKGKDQSVDSASEMNRKLLDLAKQEEDTEEWLRKFKKMSKKFAEKMSNKESLNKNDGGLQYEYTARKNELIAAVKSRLSTFSGPLSSRAKDSLSSLDKKWNDLSYGDKKRAVDTLSVIKKSIKAFGNAGEDSVKATKGATKILASLSSNFGPKGHLAAAARGLVSALLGLFGKGPKPKTLDVVVIEQINESLAEYPDLWFSRTSMMMITASFERTKAYLDAAVKSGETLDKGEVERSIQLPFMGVLTRAIHSFFKDNSVADANKGIRYCEMYAHIALYRDIILTQYIAMAAVPSTATGHDFLDALISFREAFRRIDGAVLGNLYAVDYDSAIIPYYDPDVSVITDTYSTEILNLGKYDRSMTGLYCLMHRENRVIKDLVAVNGSTTLVKHNTTNCHWKVVPHGRNTYSIVNKRFGDALLSWKTDGDSAIAIISNSIPVLWEINGRYMKSIQNKKDCGKTKTKWCDGELLLARRNSQSESAIQLTERGKVSPWRFMRRVSGLMWAD